MTEETETIGDMTRLSKLIVRNFRCIGTTPVEVDLNDIVVLVGPNNSGKSSILRAYETIMSDGAAESQLTLDDFPGGVVKDDALPEIELHTIVYDNAPGEEWCEAQEGGGNLVRERWIWKSPGKPERRGYNVELARWAEDGDKEKVPWGAAPVANARRPQPHRVNAFDPPEVQTDEILRLLMPFLRRSSRHTKRTKRNPSTPSYYPTFVNCRGWSLTRARRTFRRSKTTFRNSLGRSFRSTGLSLILAPRMRSKRASSSSQLSRSSEWVPRPVS